VRLEADYLNRFVVLRGLESSVVFRIAVQVVVVEKPVRGSVEMQGGNGG